MKFIMEAWRDPKTGKPVLNSNDKRFGPGLVVSSDWLSTTMQKRVDDALKREEDEDG